MNRLKETGIRLIVSQQIDEPLERQRAAFLSGMFLLLMLLSIMQVIVQGMLDNPQEPLMLVLRVAGIVVNLPLYLLSRSGYHRIASMIFIAAVFVVIIGGVLTGPPTYYTSSTLNFLTLALLAGGLALSHRETAFLLVLAVLAVFVVPLLYPDLPVMRGPTLTLIISVGVSMVSIGWFTQTFQQRAISNEQRYQDLMDASLEAIIIIDTNTARILDMNPAFADLVGYPEETIIGQHPTRFLLPESQEIAREMFRTLDQTAREMTVKRGDGTLAYIETMVRPHAYSGRPALVIVMRDITARTQAELALHKSEQLFRAIFDNSFQFTSVITLDGTILQINSATLRFFHLKSEEIIGKKLWDVPLWTGEGERQEAIRKLVERAALGEVVRIETSVHDSHGEQAYIDFTITPVFNDAGEVYLLLPEARDITGRYIAEQRRSEYERRYDAIFRHTADAVFIIGLDKKLITANERALDMLRCGMEDIIGSDLDKFIIYDEVALSQNIFQRLLNNESIPPVYTRKMRRIDGEVFIGEINAMLVRDGNNHPMYVLSMVRDASERMEIEQQQFELRLQRARTKLLQHFIDEASHHFRTPITNIKTSIYLLPRFLNVPEKQNEHYGIIGRELQRLENLLDDLLMVTRLQKDDSEYHIAPVMVSRMLSEVRSYYEGRDEYTQHQWKWVYEERNTLVVGDKQRISRALLNIIDNAVRYTPAGGLITIRSYDQEPWTVIEISDTGIGITEADMEHIFDDFYRGEEAMSRDSTSSGLGLSIARQIIERHQGIIRVTSRVGDGTTFQIILPINRSWDEPPLALPKTIAMPTSAVQQTRP